MKIHHIGYLVKKIDKAVKRFEALGYTLEREKIFDEIRGVDIAFLEKDGYRVELVCPVSENSVAAGLMKKYKNSPYHICYETTSFNEDMERLLADGYSQIDEPTPAVALDGKRVVFLMGADMGMIELLENDNV